MMALHLDAALVFRDQGNGRPHHRLVIARAEGPWLFQRARSALAGALDCHGATRLAMTRWG
jgi:hypothetical protein